MIGSTAITAPAIFARVEGTKIPTIPIGAKKLNQATPNRRARHGEIVQLDGTSICKTLTTRPDLGY